MKRKQGQGGEQKAPRGSSPLKKTSKEVPRSQLTFDVGPPEIEGDQTMTGKQPLPPITTTTTIVPSSGAGSVSARGQQQDLLASLGSASLSAQSADLRFTTAPSFNPFPTTTTTTTSLSGAPIQVSSSAFSDIVNSPPSSGSGSGSLAVTLRGKVFQSFDLDALNNDTQRALAVGRTAVNNTPIAVTDTSLATITQTYQKQRLSMAELYALIQKLAQTVEVQGAEYNSLLATVDGERQLVAFSQQSEADQARQSTDALVALAKANAEKDVIQSKSSKLADRLRIETEEKQRVINELGATSTQLGQLNEGIRTVLKGLLAQATTTGFKLDSPDQIELAEYVRLLSAHSERQLSETSKQLQDQTTELGKAKAANEQLNIEIETLRKDRSTFVDTEAKLGEANNDLKIQLAATESKLVNADARVQDLDQQLSASRTETKTAKDALDVQLAKQVSQAGTETDVARQAREDVEKKLGEYARQAEEIKLKAEADVKTKNAQLDELNAQMVSIRTARDALANERDALRTRYEGLLKSNGSTGEQLIQAERKLRDLEEKFQQINKLDPNVAQVPFYQGPLYITAPASAYALQRYIASETPNLSQQPTAPTLSSDAKVSTATTTTQTPVPSSTDGKDAKTSTPTTTQIPSSTDGKDTKIEPPLPKLSKADQDAVSMDWQPVDDPRGKQMIVPLGVAQRDAFQLLMVGSGGTSQTEFKKRQTFVDDVLDLDSMCEDRAWSLAIIELMNHRPSKTSFYDPYSPLSKQLESIYENAEAGSTELLFVLELMYVYNAMKDDDKRPPVRQVHIGRYIDHFIVKPLGINGPRPSHIQRICEAVDKWLGLLFESAQKTQDPTNMFWWTESPLALAVGTVYSVLGLSRLLEHSRALREMYANSQYTYHTLMMSVLGNTQFLFAFQEMCGTLWNANNFRANCKTIMDQPGGALLLDVFMAAANTKEFNARFGNHDTRRIVYAQLRESRQGSDVHAYFIDRAGATLAMQPIRAIQAQTPSLSLKS